MTSIEALDNLDDLLVLHDVDEVDKYRELEIIEKDLDILEILKKYLRSKYDYRYDANVIEFFICDFKNEDYNKIKEWLNEQEK